MSPRLRLASALLAAEEGPAAGGTLVHPALFAGQNSRTANRDTLQRAQQMMEQGADPDTIWGETGWFRGPDQRWRYEIIDREPALDGSGSDSELAPTVYEPTPKPSEVLPRFFSVLNEVRGSQQPRVLPLRDLFRHDELFGAYPELADSYVQVVPRNYLTNERALAQYSPTLRVLRINADSVENSDAQTAHNNILHELQHALQDTEDFAYGRAPGSGGSIGGVAAEYARRPGEGEARLVEERANLPTSMQRQTPPWLDEAGDRVEPSIDYTDPDRYDWDGALTYRQLAERYRHQQPDLGTPLRPKPFQRR